MIINRVLEVGSYITYSNQHNMLVYRNGWRRHQFIFLETSYFLNDSLIYTFLFISTTDMNNQVFSLVLSEVINMCVHPKLVGYL